MIDIECEVFDTVFPYLEEFVPEGGFVSEFVPDPASLPHVYLHEIDNRPDRKTSDSGYREWSAIVTFESQVYATDKGQCRTIQAALDSAMIGALGFTKTQGQAIPNLADPMIHRIVARYERGVDRFGNLYRP